MLSLFRRALATSALLGVAVIPISMAAAPAAIASAPMAVKAPASHPGSCYGYSGTFKDGAPVVHATGWSECFGIAPDRTVWHAWPNSDGWKRMPNNGLGDTIAYAGLGQNALHSVCVHVIQGDSLWQSTLWSSGWSNWLRGCVYPH